MNGTVFKSSRFWTVIGLILISVSFAASQKKASDIKLEAKQYLAAHEPLLEQTKDPSNQFYILAYLPSAALSAGETEKAKNYAQRFLALGQQLQNQPGFGSGMNGQAIHTGNIVLGRIAFDNGDIENAKTHLLAAGQTVGSPTLKSFGPDMLLAKLLIEKGEREAAIQYFELCAKFWKSERGRLNQWKDVVTEGGVPDFKANLGYETDTWRFAK